VDDDGRKQGGKEIATSTSEFQKVNNFPGSTLVTWTAGPTLISK